MRGIMCNWLVCLGVWQATAAQDIIGKIVGIYCAHPASIGQVAVDQATPALVQGVKVCGFVCSLAIGVES